VDGARAHAPGFVDGGALALSHTLTVHTPTRVAVLLLGLAIGASSRKVSFIFSVFLTHLLVMSNTSTLNGRGALLVLHCLNGLP